MENVGTRPSFPFPPSFLFLGDPSFLFLTDHVFLLSESKKKKKRKQLQHCTIKKNMILQKRSKEFHKFPVLLWHAFINTTNLGNYESMARTKKSSPLRSNFVSNSQDSLNKSNLLSNSQDSLNKQIATMKLSTST